MSVLRHPVVITSLEEDFQKIGLIKKEELQEGLPVSQGGEAGSGQQGHAANSRADGSKFAAKGSTTSKSTTTKKGGKAPPSIPYTVGGDRLNTQSDGRKDPNHDYGTTEDFDEEEIEAALAEAQAWSDEFDEEFSMSDAPIVMISEADMEELEALGEVEELPAGVLEADEELLADLFSEDDAEDADETEVEEEDEETQESAAVDFLNSLQERIGSLQESELAETRESTLPAFANIALIAEMLANTFGEAAEALEDGEYAEMAEGYGEMAKYSAGVVDFLESEEDVDYEAVGAQFREFVETLMTGVEAFRELTQEAHGSDDDDDDDDESMDEKGGMYGKGKYGKSMMKGKFGKKDVKKGKKDMQAGEY